jgi:hypothetical protein
LDVDEPKFTLVLVLSTDLLRLVDLRGLLSGLLTGTVDLRGDANLVTLIGDLRGDVTLAPTVLLGENCL